MKIGYQGSPGAYNEQAALRFAPKKEITLIRCQDFDSVADKLIKKEVDFGVLPIENALSGSIYENYNLLIGKELFINREIILPIHHNLLGLPDSTPEDIKLVYSHPQALLQCQKFISAHNLEAKIYYDTAASARKIKQDKEKAKAAIASSRAAKIYGLKVLKRNIEDNYNNFTRFWIVSTKINSKGGNKSTIIVKLPHKKGSLVDFLLVLKEAGLNLTKIESRPVVGRLWEYLFILDFEGEFKEPFVSQARKKNNLFSVFRIIRIR